MNALKRLTRAADPRPAAPDAGPVPVVDAALRLAAGRQLFTREEALGLLQEVEAEVDDPERATTVERIVADVDTGWAEQLMVSRSDVVDSLLDIRLVLCS
jgi:hypothetical protein